VVRSVIVPVNKSRAEGNDSNTNLNESSTRSRSLKTSKPVKQNTGTPSGNFKACLATAKSLGTNWLASAQFGIQ